MDIDILEYGDSRTLNKKRKEILSVSRELFIEFGIEQASMKLIADKARITRRSLYNYYDSKEQIAIDVQILNLKDMNFFETWGCVLISIDLQETLKRIPEIAKKAMGEHKFHYILISKLDSHFNQGYPDSKYPDFLRKEVAAAYPDVYIDYNPLDYRVEWFHANLLLAYIQRLATRNKSASLSYSDVQSEIELLAKLISNTNPTKK